jgi:hypothetical protein
MFVRVKKIGPYEYLYPEFPSRRKNNEQDQRLIGAAAV